MDRRSVIADAALQVIAETGLRALTHRGIDEALDLPAGSTSYYFRSRRDLLTAVIDRITDSSRSTFLEMTPTGDSVDVTVRYLENLLTDRAAQLRARHALLNDPSIDADARARLAACLFSTERATALFGDEDSANGFVALCEGLVVVALTRGYGTTSLRAPIAIYLQGAGAL